MSRTAHPRPRKAKSLGRHLADVAFHLRNARIALERAERQVAESSPVLLRPVMRRLAESLSSATMLADQAVTHAPRPKKESTDA